MTRPASKSLDEDETASFGPSGSSEALRLVGSLKRNGGVKVGGKKKKSRKETDIGGGEGEGVSVEGGVWLCGDCEQRERERK